MSRATDRLLLRVEPAKGPTVTVPAPHDLRFSTTIPGGFDELSCTVPWPASEQSPNQFAGAPVVQVVDRATGSIIWHGRVSDPGLQVHPRGNAYAIVAVGEKERLDTQRAAYALVDRDLRSWAPLNDLPAGSTAVGTDSGTVAASALDWAGDTPAGYLEVTIPNTTALATNATSTWVYLPAQNNPAAAAGIVQVTGSSKTSTHALAAAWVTELMAGPTTAAATTKVGQITNTSGAQIDWAVMVGYTGLGGTWAEALDARAFLVRSKYTGAPTTAAADYWQRHANLAVHCRRYTRSGALLSPTAGSPKDYQLTVADVVNDLLGRLLKDIVEPAAILEQPSTLVAQAAWWDGVSAREVMSFLAQLAPNNWWAVWEPGDSGRPRFTYETWLQPVRYLITPGMGEVKLAGGAEQLANQALVVYLAAENTIASLTVSATVPLLDAENLTRTTLVDAKDRGPISATRAAELGANALTAQAVRKPSGTVKVSGHLYDRLLGRVVEPWEIQPGAPVQVMDATERLAPGAVDTPDGSSIFRLTGVKFDVGSDTAVLDLDGGSRTLISRVKAEIVPVRFETV